MITQDKAEKVAEFMNSLTKEQRTKVVVVMFWLLAECEKCTIEEVIRDMREAVVNTP